MFNSLGPSVTSSMDDMRACRRLSRGLLLKGSVVRMESRLLTDPYLVDLRVPVLDISPS